MRYAVADWEVAHSVVRLDVGYPLPESDDPIVRLQPDAGGNYRIDMDKIMREHLLRPRAAPAPVAPPPKPKRRRAVPSEDSPYKTPEQAAAFLGKSPSWFSKNARRIKVQPGTGLYHVDDLVAFAAGEGLRQNRARLKGTDPE